MAILTFNGTNGPDFLNDNNGRSVYDYDPYLGLALFRSDLVYINGFNGDDNISGLYFNSSYIINGGAGNDFVYGGVNGDVIAGDDLYDGVAGNDYLLGSGGNDALFGFGGNDTLYGGTGTDTLYGGAGNDVFDFDSVSESQPGLLRDVINDFVGNGIFAGDRIDLSTIDANSNITGNQAFTFIGTRAFSAVGQVRYVGGILSGNTAGNQSPEFEIQLVGSPLLVASDIIV